MSFGRVWLLRFGFVIAGLLLTYQGLIHANAGTDIWGWELIVGILTVQMCLYVPAPLENTGPGATVTTEDLSHLGQFSSPMYDTPGSYYAKLKFPKLKKYRPAPNRKLPFYGPRHPSWGKYATSRAWKAKKRKEAKALEQATHTFLMGCAQTPVKNFGAVLEAVKEIRRVCSVKEWGR